jgi:hypothetical protein
MNAVGLIVLIIGVIGGIFTLSTVIFFANLSIQTTQVVNGNTNASQVMGQSISDEVTFDITSGIVIYLVIAVLAAIGVPTAIITALKKL